MYKKNRLLFLILLSITGMAFAQDIDEENGKSYYYYDSGKKQVKEIFHHKRMVQFGIRPEKPGEYYDTTIFIKNGPYLKYYIEGQLACSGFYLNDKKDSTWKYYNKEGILEKTEFYRNGELTQ